jgi:hypothetical protein
MDQVFVAFSEYLTFKTVGQQMTSSTFGRKLILCKLFRVFTAKHQDSVKIRLG